MFCRNKLSVFRHVTHGRFQDHNIRPKSGSSNQHKRRIILNYVSNGLAASFSGSKTVTSFTHIITPHHAHHQGLTPNLVVPLAYFVKNQRYFSSQNSSHDRSMAHLSFPRSSRLQRTIEPETAPVDPEISSNEAQYKAQQHALYFQYIVFVLLVLGLLYDRRDSIRKSAPYCYLVQQLSKALRHIDPETAHWIAVKSAHYGFAPLDISPDPSSIGVEVFDKYFANPIGLAAGFDKNAEAINALLGMGFGFVEVGTITPMPQSGNPLPRVYRLPEDLAIINRYGFNNEGVDAVLKYIASYMHTRNTQPESLQRIGAVGINVGKNKFATSEDYGIMVERVAPFADYIVVNISSPNTQGLRDLQARDQLKTLLTTCQTKLIESTRESASRPPILVKIAPDLTDDQLYDILEVVSSTKIDGIIISNTTISRPSSLVNPAHTETGGLSGRPLRDMSTDMIYKAYAYCKGSIPIIGVGGIWTGKDVLEKIRAGASLVQLYTVLAYEGPGAIIRIKHELASELKQQGFESVQEAIGCDHRLKKINCVCRIYCD